MLLWKLVWYKLNGDLINIIITFQYELYTIRVFLKYKVSYIYFAYFFLNWLIVEPFYLKYQVRGLKIQNIQSSFNLWPTDIYLFFK